MSTAAPRFLLLLAALAAGAHAEDRKPAPAAAEPAPTVALPVALPDAAPASTATPVTSAPAENPPPVNLPVPTVTPPGGDQAAEKSTTSKARKDDKNAAAKSPVPPALSPRFQQVRDRIKVLYGNRDVPHPAPDPRYNPFRAQVVVPAVAAPAPATPAASAASSSDIPPPAPAVNQNLVLIKQAAALLKVTGFVERDGRTLLNINQALYKEGDVVKVTVKSQTVLLRIKKLSRTSLTVTLGEAETTLNF